MPQKSNWIFRRYLASVLPLLVTRAVFSSTMGGTPLVTRAVPTLPRAVYYCLYQAPKGHFGLNLYGHEGAYLITGSLHYFKQSSLIQTVYTGLTS